jgi:hypothetical protein
MGDAEEPVEHDRHRTREAGDATAHNRRIFTAYLLKEAMAAVLDRKQVHVEQELTQVYSRHARRAGNSAVRSLTRRAAQTRC